MKGEEDPLLRDARILVADDEPNIRITISEILRKYHVHVTMAANGEEAIEHLDKGEFDLVISDIKMRTRVDTMFSTPARKRSQTVPVILMTGFGYDPNHSIVRASQEGLQAGVLFKPFKVDQLLSEVRKALAVETTEVRS